MPDISSEVTVCEWPRERHQERTGDCDTTKVNMGRRKMPVCSNFGCMNRVDAPRDEFCRVCRGRAGR
jgi:hypothetical protein